MMKNTFSKDFFMIIMPQYTYIYILILLDDVLYCPIFVQIKWFEFKFYSKADTRKYGFQLIPFHTSFEQHIISN